MIPRHSIAERRHHSRRAQHHHPSLAEQELSESRDQRVSVKDMVQIMSREEHQDVDLAVATPPPPEAFRDHMDAKLVGR